MDFERLSLIAEICRSFAPTFVIPVLNFNSVYVGCESLQENFCFLERFVALIGRCTFVAKPRYSSHAVRVDDTRLVVILDNVLGSFNNGEKFPYVDSLASQILIEDSLAGVKVDALVFSYQTLCGVRGVRGNALGRSFHYQYFVGCIIIKTWPLGSITGLFTIDELTQNLQTGSAMRGLSCDSFQSLIVL